MGEKKSQNFLYVRKQVLEFIIFVERKKSKSIDRMKTITSENCNIHTLYQSVKGAISKIMNNI